MQRHRFFLCGTFLVLALTVFLGAGGAWAQSDPPEPDDAGAPAQTQSKFLSGQRFNKNGEKGTASQFQFGTRFRF